MAGSRIIPKFKPLRRHDSGWRRLGFLSLGINLALAGWWGYTNRPGSGDETRTRPPPAHARLPRSGLDSTNAPAAPTITTHTLPFHWSMIESDDYAVYVANLRAVGCPEPILRDMIVAELETLYRRRYCELPEPRFWTAGAARSQASRDHRKADRALEVEKRAVYRELVSVDWPSEEHEGFESLAISEFFLGFLPQERRTRLVASIKERDAAAEAIREAADSILLPSDRAQLRVLYERWSAEMSAQFSPAELSEMRLRIGFVKGDYLDDEDFEGVAVTGQEFRELLRIQQGNVDLLREEFFGRNDLQEPGGGARVSGLDEHQQAELRRLLGDERLATYERNRDPQYRETRNFVQEHKLPPTTAAQLYEVRRALDAAAAELRADASLPAEERVARLEAMAADASGAIGRILGPAAAQAGAEQIRGWLEPLRKVSR